MSGDGRFRYPCQQQGSGATTTEGMTRVVGRVLTEDFRHPAADVADEGRVGQRGVGVGVFEEQRPVGSAVGVGHKFDVCPIGSKRAEDVVVAAGERHCRGYE